MYLLFYCTVLVYLIHLHGADGTWVWTLFLCLWLHVGRALQEHWDAPHSHTHTLLTPAARGCCHCYDTNHLFWWVFLLISTKNRHTERKSKTGAGRFCYAPPRHKCSWGENKQVRLETEIIFLTSYQCMSLTFIKWLWNIITEHWHRMQSCFGLNLKIFSLFICRKNIQICIFIYRVPINKNIPLWTIFLLWSIIMYLFYYSFFVIPTKIHCHLKFWSWKNCKNIYF